MESENKVVLKATIIVEYRNILLVEYSEFM